MGVGEGPRRARKKKQNKKKGFNTRGREAPWFFSLKGPRAQGSVKACEDED